MMTVKRVLSVGLVLSCGAVLLNGWGCSSSGEQATVKPDAPEASNDAVVVRVDAANAVRLRRLADSSVSAAVRSFGPAEGLPLDELGARLFRSRGCIECHGPGVEDPVGPNLIDAFGTMRAVEGRPALLMDLDYINVALMRPDSLIASGYSSGIMPSFEGKLYPREVLALAVYLQGMSEPPRMPEEAAEGDEVEVALAPDSEVERIEAPLIEEVDIAEEEPEPATEPVAEETPERADGRPGWWFDGVRRDEGRVWTCVEVLGDSFADTRASTIERGQAVLAERLGLGPAEELKDPRVKYIWVTPLPNRGVERRYAGYAMMSAIAE
jgi:hypothetical protein